MSIETFIEKFAFAIEVSPDALTADTDYKALDIWDSLNALSVIAMADSDFNVTIGGQDVERSRTISDLWAIVQKRMAAT